MTTIVSNPSTNTEREDIRQQLFNAGHTGPISQILVSADEVTKLRGILFDIDPAVLRPGSLLGQISLDPVELYEQTVKPWLTRHPVLRHCEVRVSGTGLHVILRLAEPVILKKINDLQRWLGIVKTVQTALPTDPDLPGITACTRAVGSINSKNGAKVFRLTSGQPVAAEQVVQLYRQMMTAPFRTVLEIVTGGQEVSPCPLCSDRERTLKALDRLGLCYDSCNSVSLYQLYDLMVQPRTLVGGKKDRHAGS